MPDDTEKPTDSVLDAELRDLARRIAAQPRAPLPPASEREVLVLIDLFETHRADLLAAADGDVSAVSRIALTSVYSRDAVTRTAQLLAAMRGQR